MTTRRPETGRELEGVATASTPTRTSPKGTSAPLIPLEQADDATRMFIEMGFHAEDFGVAV